MGMAVDEIVAIDRHRWAFVAGSQENWLAA